MSVHTALKPYATAGVAIVGAGVLAVTPAAAPSPNLSRVGDVALTADGSPFGDFLAPWLDQYNSAAENTTQLANNFFVAPWVGLQQAIANQGDFWQQLADDPTKLGEVTLAMQDNVKAVLDSYTLLGASDDTVATVTGHTLSGDPDAGLLGHYDLVSFLPTLVDGGLIPLPEGTDPDMVTEIVNFLASPASGIIMGALGPAISPWIALSNSITDGDGFNEIMANMVGGYFNGATLNLDFVLPMIDDADVLPEGMSMDHLELAFGGLLTPGEVANAPYTFFDSSGDVVNEVPGVGGSILNSLGLQLTGVPALNELGFDGHAVGPIAAWQGFSQAVAGLLGADPNAWAWAGKNAGTPPQADPPLSGGSLPTIPDDFFDDGGASNELASTAADSLDWADVAAAFGL
jgi:hypothetical protein